MRITTKMFYDRFLNDFTNNMEAIFKSQEQISSMKKLNRPSDDPAAMARVVGYKTQVSAIDEYKRSIGFAGDSLGSIDTGLSSLNNLIIRAKELALEGADGSATAEERTTIAKEIGVMLDSAIDIANTKVGDRYVFAGYKSNVTPIDKQTGEYLSDSSTIEVDINLGTKIGVNIPANDLFSFKRNKATDSSTSILPAYNNDIDPNSALYSSAGFFVIDSSNNKIQVNEGGVSGTATIAAGTYTADQLTVKVEDALHGATVSANTYTVTYDDSARKFKILSNTGNADMSLLWKDPRTNSAQTLGFRTENAVDISAGESDTSDNATGFTSASSVFSSNGGTLTIKVGDDDATPVDVTVSAGAKLSDIKDAINIANAGVKAEVVDMGTSSAPDYRIVIASYPAGKSGDVRIAASTNDPAGTGLNTLVYMSSADSITINSTNNQIVFNEGNGDQTIYIPEGPYNADQLASMIQSKMEAVDSTVANTYSVTYESSSKKFKIINNLGNLNILDMKWENVNSTAAGVLGYTAADHALVSPPASVTSNVPPMAGAGAGPFVIDATNNTIAVTEGGNSVTVTIPVGTYNTGSDLAAALETALESASSSANTYTVSYDASGGAGTETFSISSMAGNTDDLTVKWTDPSSLNAAGVFKFNADSSLLRTTLASDNALTYGVQSNTFDYNVKNYNYIEDATNSNYYSFNNNYLNGTADEDGNVHGYILRALSFLKISLENNDPGRIQKAVDYLDRVADKVFKAQAEVGSRLNKLDAEGEIFANRELDIALYMSNDEDADIAKAASDMAQRQTALQGLRTASLEFMRTSLFDFLR